MSSKNQYDDFLFSHRHTRRDAQKHSQDLPEDIKEMLKKKGNYQRSKKVSPLRRPPVPVVLDPIPPQITPVGTIPIYYRRFSKYHSQESSSIDK
jgi:hypothetical protein